MIPAAAPSPRATVRLQLHQGYTLEDARTNLPYFARLGISHLYLSPITQAKAGSTHGYDVVDHGNVDDARGGETALRRLAAEARQAGMGILLDIVPNHMATDPGNAWWWDVLSVGRHSAWAQWFDIDWQASALPGKVLLPFLAQPYEQALAAGDIRLVHDSTLGLHVRAGSRPYPLAPESLPGGDAGSVTLRASLAAHDPAHAQGRQRLHELLSRQHYQLAWWRRAADSINWRRFFEVSDLIGVCVERQDVFDAVHALPLKLYAEGLIDGLRIDHVDGLAQPLAYCRQLRAAMRTADAQRPPALRIDPPWVVVEKILAPDETLDARWDVSGTTGYDFAADAGALLHDGKGEAALFQGWAEISGDARPAQVWLLHTRQEMLDRHFMAERAALQHALWLARQSEQEGRASQPDWAASLDALLCHYPVYRSYVEHTLRLPADQRWFEQAWAGARAGLGADASHDEQLEQLNRLLGGEPATTRERQQALARFQQLTPPLAAKSLEDTVFYRYGCLLSRNEVGSHPGVFALSVQEFHARNQHRAQAAPWGLLATATHDHKRGEDVRARLAVLSEIPQEWLNVSRHWLTWAPQGAQPAFAYMLLQTLVGAWPPELSAGDGPALKHYLNRVAEWAVKALREGKQLSSWFEPDEAQEALWLGWLDDMRPGAPCHALACSIEALVRRLEPAGIANGLIQVALRLSCPGIPDLYQGTEWRDFSLVDPDNRRPVDFRARQYSLKQAAQGDACWRPPLAAHNWPASAWADGRVKQALIAVMLQLRRECDDAFQGDYRPMVVQGSQPDAWLAFSREAEVVVVAGVKSVSALSAGEDGMPRLPFNADLNGVLELPDRHPAWHDVLRGRMRCAEDGKLSLAELLDGFPLAVLRRDQG